MSTVEERINKHQRLAEHAERLQTKYRNLELKWEEKAKFHRQALKNLNNKTKPSEEKK